MVNPNPQKKAISKPLTTEDMEQYKEERIDRVKREKDNLMNIEKWLINI